jgi:uncharacterized membrane protein
VNAKYLVAVELFVLVLSIGLFVWGQVFLGLAGLIVAAVGGVMIFREVRADRRG